MIPIFTLETVGDLSIVNIMVHNGVKSFQKNYAKNKEQAYGQNKEADQNLWC